MADEQINANTSIVIFPSSLAKAQSASVDTRVTQLIRSELLLKTNDPYLKVQADLRFGDNGKIRRIIAHMLRADIYLDRVVQITVDDQLNVVAFEEGMDGVEEEEQDSVSEPLTEAGPLTGTKGTFYCATPTIEFPSAVEAVEQVAKYAAAAGYQVTKWLGADASIKNYQTALRSKSVGFFSVGHGSPYGLTLSDGFLGSDWILSLSSTALNPEVIYLNSCQVFNSPLLPAIMSKGARTYFGGITDLPVGPSEKVAKLFWKKTLSENVTMLQALTDAKKIYPGAGNLGMLGDTGLLGICWVKMMFGKVPANAFQGGQESYDKALYVARGVVGGGIHPGKTAPHLVNARIPYGGDEKELPDYEVLVLSVPSKWVPCLMGVIPKGAIQGGQESDGKPLYIARANFKNGVHPGKVGKHLKGGRIPYGGKEHKVTSCEVLVIDV